MTARIVVVTPPATEPLTAAEARALALIDGTNAEPAPTAITVALASPGAAGNVDNGAHRYLATFVTADGETQAGAVSAAVTVANKAVNGQVSLTGIPIGGAAVTARKLYRTAAAGSTCLLLATLADNTTTTYTDNTADSGLGAQAPTTNTTADSLLNLLIASARAYAEQQLGRKLITQTLDAYFEGFPNSHGWPMSRESEYRSAHHAHDHRILELMPLQSVTSITYIDTAGNTQTLDPTLYQVDATSGVRFARIAPAYQTYWPMTRHQMNAVVVRFVAGYGAAAAVPACVRYWMGQRIKTMYDNRDQLVLGDGRLVQMPSTYVDGLLDPERVVGWTH